jgi:hypothetical protein
MICYVARKKEVAFCDNGDKEVTNDICSDCYESHALAREKVQSLARERFHAYWNAVHEKGLNCSVSREEDDSGDCAIVKCGRDSVLYYVGTVVVVTKKGDDAK